MLKSPKLKLWQWLAVSLVVVNLAVVYHVYTRPDGLVHIYFFDVGQGDAIFVKTANNQRILIDGGPGSRVIKLLDPLLPVWDRRLDLVVLTHPHADYAAGLIEVVKRYQVDEFLFNGMEYETETYNTLLDLVTSKHIPTQIADSSDRYLFGGVDFDVIYPFREYTSTSDPNDSSVVAILRYKNFQLLLTGDAGVVVENNLLKAQLLSDVDVLKVGHQGSRGSTSQTFVKVVDPELAIIPVGRNDFGHPHKEVIDRLELLRAQIYRTDQDGTIEVTTDGLRYVERLHP